MQSYHGIFMYYLFLSTVNSVGAMSRAFGMASGANTNSNSGAMTSLFRKKIGSGFVHRVLCFLEAPIN